MSKQQPRRHPKRKASAAALASSEAPFAGTWQQWSVVGLWNQFWFRRFDPISVGVFRILTGSLLVIMFAASYPNWNMFYAADGVNSLIDPALDPYRPLTGWSFFALTEGVLPTMFWWWAGAIAAVCFTVGVAARPVTIFLFLLLCSMVNRTPVMVNGEDMVFRMLFFHGMFAPLGYSLSVDSWLAKQWRNRKHNAATPQQPMIWAVRMMQINVALIYVISLPFKLFDDVAWLNGDAIYWTLASDMWSRQWFPQLGYWYGGLFSKLATFGTIFVEAQFPILVCFRRTRLLAIGLVTALHLGIALMVPNVALFTLSMVAAFWLFMPPETTRKWLGKLHVLRD